MCFFGLFRAKMTTISIQNPKIIVSINYQQFLAHFDWFLSLFQISDVKPELSPDKLKLCKNGIFGAKNLFKINVTLVNFVPQSKLCKKIRPKWPLGGCFKRPP